MKKVAAISFVALAVMACGSSRSVRAEEIKIGSVNFQQALNEVEQGKKAKAGLKAEFDAKQKKLSLQQDELKKMQDEAQKQGQVLSKEAMAEKQRVFQEKLAELQKNMGEYRDELVQKEAKSTGQIKEEPEDGCGGGRPKGRVYADHGDLTGRRPVRKDDRGSDDSDDYSLQSKVHRSVKGGIESKNAQGCDRQ